MNKSQLQILADRGSYKGFYTRLSKVNIKIIAFVLISKPILLILGIASSSGTRQVTRQYLYNQMQGQNLTSLEEKLDFLEDNLLSCHAYTAEYVQTFKKSFSYFKAQLKEKWTKARRKEDAFLKANQAWLNGTIEIPNKSHFRPGRPLKSFEKCSERSKRRKTEEVRSMVEDTVIIHAAQSTLIAKGQRDASRILKEIAESPSRAAKYKSAYKESTSPGRGNILTPHAALAMFVEADLTREQYEIIRNTNPYLYPCYDRLLEAKKECYQTQIRVTSSYAETDLQSLIDKTIMRLSMYLEEVLLTLSEDERNSLTIICKWGCDGSQQAKYKQKIEDTSGSDANIFLSSFVPLQITCGNENRKIVWQNPSPSSPRFCRPIRFRFIKESIDVTKEEINFVESSVNNLVASEIELQGNKFVFRHIFKMTMIDGKVCNAATDTRSTSQCYLCKATSKDFNNLDKKNEVSLDSLDFGLSVLHARIRLFESILHLAYNLPVKKYRAKRTAEEELLEKTTKETIQKRFRDELGLLIDMPKANYGNTNDGNTSRRFFENPKLAADITGVDYNFIYRLKIILEAISSGYEIDSAKYDEYALDTAKLYIKLYAWHPMTPTMHKILVHGAAIIENSLLPIGQLSEEAQEARNKHFRMYRENYARKFSREECNRDIYHRLLLSSDPFLSSISVHRRRKKKASKSLSPDTIKLLVPFKYVDKDVTEHLNSEGEN